MTKATEESSTTSLVLKQVQTIVTLSYLFMVGVGMLYYHQKYSEFNINIFQYADIFYFLVAPFEDSFIFIWSSVAVIITLISYLIDPMLERNYPRIYAWMSFGLNNKPWYPRVRTIMWPMSFIIVLYMYADIYGEKTKEDIINSEPTIIRFVDNQTLSGKLIGKTSSVLFVIDNNIVKAIPIESLIKEIQIAPVSISEQGTEEKTNE